MVTSDVNNIYEFDLTFQMNVFLRTVIPYTYFLSLDKVQNRGLKLKLVKGTLSKEKCSAGRSSMRKKLMRATNYQKSSENKLNLIKNNNNCCQFLRCSRAACLRPLVWKMFDFLKELKKIYLKNFIKKIPIKLRTENVVCLIGF